MRRIESVNKNGKWKPDGKSLDLHECPEWFKDAKFGIFVDWGFWSLASWAPKSRKGAMYPDWYELRMYSDFDSNSPFWGYRSYHVKNWGADFQRDHFIPLFQAKILIRKNSLTYLKNAAQSMSYRFQNIILVFVCGLRRTLFAIPLKWDPSATSPEKLLILAVEMGLNSDFILASANGSSPFWISAEILLIVHGTK